MTYIRGDFARQKIEGELESRIRRQVSVRFGGEFSETQYGDISRRTVLTLRESLATAVEYPKGDPKNPLSDAGLPERFRTLRVGIVEGNRIAALKDAVDRFDQIRDVRELTQLLKI